MNPKLRELFAGGDPAPEARSPTIEVQVTLGAGNFMSSDSQGV